MLDGLLSPVHQPSVSPEAENPKPVENVCVEMAKPNARKRRRRPQGHAGADPWANPRRSNRNRRSRSGSTKLWSSPTATGHGKPAVNSATWSNGPWPITADESEKHVLPSNR